MSEARVRKAFSSDGTEIAARVEGEGPPLVLLPAGPGTSEASWGPLLPFLRGKFTCHLLNTRGRGLSADHPDHSTQRLVEDVVAYAEGLAEPVNVLGWGSDLFAHVAASKPESVAAVACYEPGAMEVMSEDTMPRFGEVVGRVSELTQAGELLQAARSFIENAGVVYSEADLGRDEPARFWEAAAPNLPVFFQEEQAAQAGPPGTDPSVLERITAPVLLLRGTLTSPWFTDSVSYVAGHLEDGRVCEIEDAAHFGPHTAPQAIAAELTRFFRDSS